MSPSRRKIAGLSIVRRPKSPSGSKAARARCGIALHEAIAAALVSSVMACPGVLLDHDGQIASRVVGACDHNDPTRPPPVCVVVAGDAPDCYVALGAVHGRWKPLPARFKDFIAMPKFNLYQSLHTTVFGPRDELVQVLIRTESMHRTAEHGIVAYLRDPGGGHAEHPGGPGGRPGDLDWLRRLLDWQREAPDPREFLHSLRHDLTDLQVVLFTPKGDALTLPEGATPVDFAYALGG